MGKVHLLARSISQANLEGVWLLNARKCKMPKNNGTGIVAIHNRRIKIAVLSRPRESHSPAAPVAFLLEGGVHGGEISHNTDGRKAHKRSRNASTISAIMNGKPGVTLVSSRPSK